MQEKLDKAAERERDLYDTNKRLENHIQDLESRKRAPLYQKKQEEELRAQTEKAQEAEIRAQDAELKCKEAKASLWASILPHLHHVGNLHLQRCILVLAKSVIGVQDEVLIQDGKCSPRRLMFLEACLNP